MEKNIKIEIPDGYDDAVYNGETKTIEFVKKVNNPQTWNELTKERGIEDACFELFIDRHGTIFAYYDYIEKLNPFPNQNLNVESYVALYKLVALRNAWVGNWSPKYDKDETVVAICNVNDTLLVDIVKDYRNHALSFPTLTMCGRFYKCFGDLIELAKPLL